MNLLRTTLPLLLPPQQLRCNPHELIGRVLTQSLFGIRKLLNQPWNLKIIPYRRQCKHTRKLALRPAPRPVVCPIRKLRNYRSPQRLQYTKPPQGLSPSELPISIASNPVKRARKFRSNLPQSPRFVRRYPSHHPRQPVCPDLPDSMRRHLHTRSIIDRMCLHINKQPFAQSFPIILRLPLSWPQDGSKQRHARAHPQDRQNAPAPLHWEILSQTPQNPE